MSCCCAVSRAVNDLALVGMLFSNPYVTVPRAADRLDVSPQSARKLIRSLAELGIVEEAPGQGRARTYHAPRLLRTLEEAAGPPDRSDRHCS